MSTRAQIAFYQSEHDPIDMNGTVYIYQHSDGHPDGILPVLEPFARSFKAHRGLKDTPYATARCVVALATVQDAEEAGYLGLGAGTTLYPTIAFFYHVSPTRIGVYAVSDASGPTPDFRLVSAVPLALPAVPQPQGQTIPGEGR